MNNPDPSSASLFPILKAPLTGLARIAAEGEHAEDGHLVEFRTMQVRSILNRSVSRRQLSLDLSINPYRGCEFGCKYCYARYTHEFLAPRSSAAPRDGAVGAVPGAGFGPEWVSGPKPVDFHDPTSFDRVIFMKQNAAWLLEQELRRVDPGLEIALGTATDPYQPIERRALITRSILEVFARKSGFRLGIVTKSRLIERDIDLLQRIARQNTLVVHITITTDDAVLARKLEPRAPRPDLRFAAVRRLRDAGIPVGVLCCPLLPGITDSDQAIDAMARRSAAAGALFFAGNPLFLKACSRPTYLSFVREHFPSLVADHEQRFGAADFAAPPYRRQLALSVARACRRYGLRERSHDALLTREMKTERVPKTSRHANAGGLSAVTAGSDPGADSIRKAPQRVMAFGQQRLFG
ncbi:MAG: radical SAM protein [Acidobacteriota bacterium]|nr:radical SAM protein [Acidobacteriota bacterium]